MLKYFTPINIVGPVNMINVNRDVWNKLDQKTRDAILEIAAEMEDEMWNLAGDMDRKSRAILRENGMIINPVNAGFRAELNEVGEQLRAEWAQKAGDDAQAILAQYYKITGRK